MKGQQSGKRRNGILVKWLLSYIMILIIPITVGMLLYLSFERIIRDDISDVSGYVINQIRLNFDNITSEVSGLSRQIAFDDDMGELMEKERFDAHDRLRIMKALKKCAAYKVGSTLIDDYYVYMKKSNSVIGYSGYKESDDLGSVIPDTEKYPHEIWESILRGEKNYKIISYAYAAEDSAFVDAVSYVVPIPLYTDDPEGFIVVGISKERCRGIVDEIYPDSDFAVLDADSNIIFCTMDLVDSKGFAEGLDSAQNGKMKYNGVKYFVEQEHSGVNSLRYVSVTRQDVVYRKLLYSRRLMAVAYTVCLLLGVLCAVYFSYKNYKPMKSILGLLFKRKLLQSGMDYEEGQLIIETIDKLVNDKNNMDKELYKQHDYVCSNALSRLINRGFSETVTKERFRQMCDLSFDKELFAVLSFHIYEREDGGDIEEKELKFLIIKNIFEELLGQYFVVYIAEINGGICAVLNFDSADGYKELLKETALYGKDVVLTNFNLELAVSASTVQKGINSVPQCYTEAEAAMQNLIFKHSKDLMFYENLIEENMSGYEYYFSFSLEQKLINFIKAGDKESANEIIGSVFEKYDNEAVEIDTIRFMVYDLSAAVFKAACGFQSGNAAKMLSEITNMNKVDIAMLREKFFGLVDALCDAAIQNADSSENEIVDRIKDMVKKEYRNMDFNVSHIADSLGLNATYISRIFSERTGDGLLNYINKYRIEKAKELLANQDLTLENVGIMVGFASANTFIRVFKKYEYMTPGQYRKMK